MKRIELTDDLIGRIKKAVGEDVNTDGFAVFEAIAVNTHPLPGKDGTIFERAQISSLTIRQMADSITGGNHLPLISNHDGADVPKGRVFEAQSMLNDAGADELRVLFYVDGTEALTASKLDAGSLDEVSVAFLASQILCSECGFDYRGPEATFAHLYNRTCENGHEIGTDGIHARLVGLSVFTELSLVSRGAAKEAKIIGKSQSKLAAPLQQLAARGFEVDRLYLRASKGEEDVDVSLVTMLSDTKADLKVAQLGLEAKTTEVSTLSGQVTELTGKVSTLETELADAKAASKATELEAATAELEEAKTFFADVYVKLAVAAGETDPKAPESIADLKAGIETHQSKLSAMLPIGGVTNDTKGAPVTGSKFRGTDGFRAGR
jgi:polyhydroxyalkanoate synthesis regulator phasin